MPKGGPKRAGSKWSALEMLVKAGKEEDIPTSQIWEIVFSVDPEDYTIPILRLALSGLTFGSIPDRHAGRYSQAAEDRAFACLCLLSKVGQAWCSYPDIGAPAIELIIDRCEGICGWTHWIAVRRKKQYFDNSDSEASDSKIDRQNCIDLARLLVNLIALPGEAIIHAFAATRYFVAALLQLWTTRDKESLFLIELDPQGDPIMNLLLEVVDNTQARDSILEKLNSRKTDAANFAVALTGRAVQARRTILASNPHEEIFWLARNLVVVLQFILNMTTNLASDMLRHSFDKVNYLTEFALLLHAISVALEEGKVPTSAELSMHDVVHLLTRLVTTIDIHYRVPRSWGKLVAGKIDATFTRIILAIPPDGDMKYQKSIGTNLDIFRLFTVYPALLQPILSWGHEDRDPIRVRAANAPETVASTRLKQFMVAGVKRADVYWKFRDSKMFFVCDNSSVGVLVKWETLYD